ncbi:MAG: hypothetical protein KF749_08715 [Bacteroidetes bacterium]|nr:hypothetical protein [Bacteroidota bacterium]MCW5895912.1 hypothetical protein [Bacteroidota bacterium]
MISREELSEIIKSSASKVEQRASEGIHSEETFKLLHANLVSYSQRKTHVPFALVISEDDVSTLSIGDIADRLANLLDTVLLTHNYIVISSQIASIESRQDDISDSNEARRLFTEMSKHGLCVFFVGDRRIIYFVQGNDFGDGVFCTEKAIKAYLQKREISQIEEVIDEYRGRLKEQATYCKFFVYKTTLKRLFPPSQIPKRKNLLKNKPENTFRNDLLMFLKANIMGTFVFAKELLLESGNRLDIWTYDQNGNYIIIEVKWIGQSISQNEKKVGHTIGPKYIKEEAVPQVLGYIKEARDLKFGVRSGYLVVFDARVNRDGDSLDVIDLTYVQKDLHPYVHLFRKIPDLEVDNIIPN